MNETEITYQHHGNGKCKVLREIEFVCMILS